MSRDNKRNFVEEILNKNNSLVSHDQILNIIFQRTSRLAMLEEFYTNVLTEEIVIKSDSIGFINTDFEEEIDEAVHYIPVGLVACLESYFRTMSKVLIDGDEKYKANASKLKINFTLSTAIELDINNLTIGDLVSHLTKLNNLADINSNMSTIMGEDFLSGLKIWRKKMETQKDLFEYTDDDKNSHFIQRIDDLYSYRNKVCHEAYIESQSSSIVPITPYSSLVIELLNVCNAYINDHLNSTKNNIT